MDFHGLSLSSLTQISLTPHLSFSQFSSTKEIALDGELISVAPQIDAIAKVSVVNSSGQMLYETFGEEPFFIIFAVFSSTSNLSAPLVITRSGVPGHRGRLQNGDNRRKTR